MDFLKKVFNKLNIPLLVFFAYSIRVLYFGAKYQDAPVLLIFALIYCFIKYLDTKNNLITENQFRVQVNNDIASIKSSLSSLSMQRNGNPFQKR